MLAVKARGKFPEYREFNREFRKIWNIEFVWSAPLW